MSRKAILIIGLFVAFSGCNQLEDVNSNTEAKNASAIAEFYDFSWKGYVEADNCYRPHVAIDAQILYTVGQLNGVNSVGRLDQIKISDITTEEMADGCAITYQATMPVAWGYAEKASETYTFLLPRNLGQDAIDQFVERYTADCLTWGAHDVDDGVFWYYYRPKNSACKLDPNDVIELVAELGPNEQATEGKYPEYDKVWEDDVLNVVAIFGKAVEESTGYDGGISAFGKFRRLVEQELGDAVTFAETVGEREGAVTTIKAELEDGKRVNVHVFMIRSVSAAGDAFWTAYESLTPTADYIVYNGHSGLGQNVRKLARRGEWQTGQYAIVFMNGCDTFAYIDSALADAHAAVNEDDPDGTKYLDVVANAMPSYVSSTPSATMAILIGLLSYDAPMTYEEILSLIDPREVALVTGEHDNTFEPSPTL